MARAVRRPRPWRPSPGRCPRGSVVQIHSTHSGKPRHDSRLTPLVPPCATTNGHGHARDVPQRLSSPSARNAGGTTINATNSRRRSARPQNRRRPTTHPDTPPIPSESSDTIVAKTKLLREHVQAKSSKSHRTSGNKCGERRASPTGPRSTKTASGRATTGENRTSPKIRIATERSQRTTNIRHPALDRPNAPTQEPWTRHRNRNRAQF